MNIVDSVQTAPESSNKELSDLGLLCLLMSVCPNT